jgi:hypothetical protein
VEVAAVVVAAEAAGEFGFFRVWNIENRIPVDCVSHPFPLFFAANFPQNTAVTLLPKNPNQKNQKRKRWRSAVAVISLEEVTEVAVITRDLHQSNLKLQIIFILKLIKIESGLVWKEA